MRRYNAKPPNRDTVIDIKLSETPSPAPKRALTGKILNKMGWAKVQEQVKVKGKKWQKEADIQKIEKHEYRRKRELENERERKNFYNTSKTTIGPGGMRILKKEEAKKRAQ